MSMTECATDIQRRANQAPSHLHTEATQGEIDDVVADIIPEGWEWIEATTVGGPPRIVLTRFSKEA